MAIDHIMIKVNSWKKALTFYSVALKPIGYELLLDNDTWGGFHVPGSFEGRIYVKQEENPGRIHFAIAAPSSDAVKAFYSAALANGGTDNGAPGYRAHYRPGGVGCFVIDLDNNNIEVVCH